VRRAAYVARFFYVVTPIPPLMAVAFMACVVAAAVIIPVNQGRAAGSLIPVLLLQMFACSSGFDLPARRGHYDLLLTSGERRIRAALAHWLASAVPGLLAWAVVIGIESMARFGSPPATFSSGTIAAVFLVSTVPWAATIRLPRFAAAIGWLVVVAIGAVAAPDLVHIAAIDPPRWNSFATAALAVAIYPPVIIGRDLLGPWGLSTAPAVLGAAAAMVAACASIERRDIPLEAAQ
jgi:hypothetical protein